MGCCNVCILSKGYCSLLRKISFALFNGVAYCPLPICLLCFQFTIFETANDYHLRGHSKAGQAFYGGQEVQGTVSDNCLVTVCDKGEGTKIRQNLLNVMFEQPLPSQILWGLLSCCGNCDHFTPILNKFNNRISARFFRYYPTKANYPCVRLELYGCQT